MQGCCGKLPAMVPGRVRLCADPVTNFRLHPREIIPMAMAKQGIRTKMVFRTFFRM